MNWDDFSPKEILIYPEVLEYPAIGEFIKEKLSALLECMDESAFSYSGGEMLVQKQFHKSLDELNLEEKPEIVVRWERCDHLKQTQRTGMERMNQISCYANAQFMRLDLNTRRNLELLETMRNKEKKGSLLWVLDKTRTAMGKRLIRTWLGTSPAESGTDHPPPRRCGGMGGGWDVV